MRSSTALQSRAFGMTDVHSENGRLVVMKTASVSARSLMTWKRNSAPSLGQGHVAHLVEGDQVVVLPAAEDAAELAVIARFDEFVDERRRGGEANPLALAAGFATQRRHQVGFAGPSFTQEDDRLGAFEVAAFRQFAYLRRGDAGGVEVELFQGFDVGSLALTSAGRSRRSRSSSSAARRVSR